MLHAQQDLTGKKRYCGEKAVCPYAYCRIPADAVESEFGVNVLLHYNTQIADSNTPDKVFPAHHFGYRILYGESGREDAV